MLKVCGVYFDSGLLHAHGAKAGSGGGMPKREVCSFSFFLVGHQASGPRFICLHMMLISAMSSDVNMMTKSIIVVATLPVETSLTAVHVGIISCMAHGCLPISATIYPASLHTHARGIMATAARCSHLYRVISRLNVMNRRTRKKSMKSEPKPTMTRKA